MQNPNPMFLTGHERHDSSIPSPFSILSHFQIQNVQPRVEQKVHRYSRIYLKVDHSVSSGTCFTKNECSSQGGVADGGCAQGFGVCCSFTETCDSTTSQNGTYFISPTTGSLPSVCSLLISPVNDNICQVRVNFETLTLQDPDSNGDCKTEYVQVRRSMQNVSKTFVFV